jgi:hypothetical protein
MPKPKACAVSVTVDDVPMDTLPAILLVAPFPIATPLITVALAPLPIATVDACEDVAELPTAIAVDADATDETPIAIPLVPLAPAPLPIAIADDCDAVAEFPIETAAAADADADEPTATALVADANAEKPAAIAFVPDGFVLDPIPTLPAPDTNDAPPFTLQLAIPVPAVVSTHTNSAQPPDEPNIKTVTAALDCTVTNWEATRFTILNVNPFDSVVTTGRTTVWGLEPVKYCVCALVAVSVVVPEAVAVVAYNDVYCFHW